jgi:hypothetical protein
MVQVHPGPPTRAKAAASPRTRRRCVRLVALASGSLLAVAAMAVVVPVVLASRSGPRAAAPAIAPFRLLFSVAVNDQSRVFPGKGPLPSFAVTPGESLRLRIGVTVPAHATVTTLWLGITGGVVGSPGQHGQRPAGMRTVLAHTRNPLTPGLHTFRLEWTVPAGFRHAVTPLLLAAAWAAHQQDARVGQPVAGLVRPDRASGPGELIRPATRS